MKQRILGKDVRLFSIEIIDVHVNISSYYFNKMYMQYQQFDLQFHKYFLAHKQQICCNCDDKQYRRLQTPYRHVFFFSGLIELESKLQDKGIKQIWS